MNAKELIAVAEKVLADWNFIREKLRDEKTPKTPVENLASHILATVRADDDEPLTEEFVERTRLASYFIEQDGMWMLTGQLYEIEFAGVKTRGEFRQLYRLLGGQMKEDGNYAA